MVLSSRFLSSILNVKSKHRPGSKEEDSDNRVMASAFQNSPVLENEICLVLAHGPCGFPNGS